MKIEEFWEDIIIYSIIFKSEMGNEIKRLIVLPMEIEDDETTETIETIIIKKFNRVKEIIRIERIEEGLAIKKGC